MTPNCFDLIFLLKLTSIYVLKTQTNENIFAFIPAHFFRQMSLLEAYSHTDYVLEGNVYNYVIKKAVLEGHYVFLPFSEAGGSVRTHMMYVKPNTTFTRSKMIWIEI